VLGDHFAAALGEGIALVDPAMMQAERAAALLRAREPIDESGATRYVTSGDPETFKANIVRLAGERNPRVERLTGDPRERARRRVSL
jgi:glutamate racemase